MATFGFLKNDTLAVLAILSFIESKKSFQKAIRAHFIV